MPRFRNQHFVKRVNLRKKVKIFRKTTEIFQKKNVGEEHVQHVVKRASRGTQKATSVKLEKVFRKSKNWSSGRVKITSEGRKSTSRKHLLRPLLAFRDLPARVSEKKTKSRFSTLRRAHYADHSCTQYWHLVGRSGDPKSTKIDLST